MVWQIVFRRMSPQPHSYLHPRGLEYNGICPSFAQFANAWPVARVASARELRARRPQPQMVIASFPQRPSFQETHLYGKRESRRRHSTVPSRGDWMPERRYGLDEIAPTTPRNEFGQRKCVSCQSIGGVCCFGATPQDNFGPPRILVFSICRYARYGYIAVPGESNRSQGGSNSRP